MEENPWNVHIVRLAHLTWDRFQKECEHKIANFCTYEVGCDVDDRCCLYACPFAQPKK